MKNITGEAANNIKARTATPVIAAVTNELLILKIDISMRTRKELEDTNIEILENFLRNLDTRFGPN